MPAQVSKSRPTTSTAEQRLGAVADQLRGAHRLGDLAVLDHVRLGDAEDEVAGRGVDLAAAERDAVEPVRRLADDFVRVLRAGSEERVGHPHHREVLVRLSPSVAAARTPLLAGAYEVPHVVGQHPVLDQDVALRGCALVVDRVRAPLARQATVVDQGHQRRRDLLAHPAPEHRRVPLDEVGLEPVAARLVEEHATRAPLQHDGYLAARCGPGVQLRERPRRGDAGDLLGCVLVEVLEPDREPGRLHPGLHPGVPDRDAADHEPGPDLVVLGEQPVGVRDEDPATTVRVARGDLAHRVALGPRGLVGADRASRPCAPSPPPRAAPARRAAGRGRGASSGTIVAPGPPELAAAAAASAASPSPVSERSAVCA